MNNKTKIDPKKIILEYSLITLAMIISTIAAYFFMIPGNIIIGSVTGIAMIISAVTPIPMSVVTLILNIALLVIGYFVVGKDFGTKTVYTSILFPFLLYVCEIFFPNQQSIMEDPWLDLVSFILIFAVAQSILFRINASSGGLDVVAKIVNITTGMPIGAAVSLVGSVVSLSAIFAYEPKTVILGLIGTYLNGIMINHFTDSFNQKKRICILSPEYEVISRFIMNKLGRGVTLYPMMGAYTKREGYEIQIVIENNQLMDVINFVKSVDENAFISISSVNSIHGRWRSRKEIRQLQGNG